MTLLLALMMSQPPTVEQRLQTLEKATTDAGRALLFKQTDTSASASKTVVTTFPRPMAAPAVLPLWVKAAPKATPARNFWELRPRLRFVKPGFLATSFTP